MKSPKPINLLLLSALSFILANNLHFIVDWKLPATLLDIAGYALFIWGTIIISRN